jgi:class 3 adenylate cyclase/tetratricopeptide (TPR) repeat protein
MKCSRCEFENRDGVTYCERCGIPLGFACSKCGAEIPGDRQFCGQCGERIAEAAGTGKNAAFPDRERKFVTALFSDLSGYSAMAAKLDPEEVKEIMSQIFGEIAQVVARYEGFIERFVGDAVMALFGVPKVHEDDAVRAIKAAKEIHLAVEALSPKFEKKIGSRLSMHSGINTGLVVTGEVNLEKGTHGITGQAINLASQLQRFAEAGEILVGPDTHRQAQGHFTFEALNPIKVKGSVEPIPVARVLSQKEQPVTVHRLSGLRADLIGRDVELGALREAIGNLRDGRSAVFAIWGDVGTGKSRLVEELKAGGAVKGVQWVEGHAYAYAQNIPYFPLKDILNRAVPIDEDDPPAAVREKITSWTEDVLGGKDDALPYLGSLYALSYPELEDVGPEVWKSRLRAAALRIFSALAHKAPTVFWIEDLHWADPSFVDLLRTCLVQFHEPAVFLCAYRPPFTLFTPDQLGPVAESYREIRLHDLSAPEAQEMLESLLKTDTIPTDLRNFVQDKAEGNPFYLEELVNALIESETLVREHRVWKAARSLNQWEIPSTIHGVITGRLDRLEKEKKRVLQQASVLGRSFLYEILKRVTDLKQDIDPCLRSLEQASLIKARTLEPDLEYVFKHALTQEVAYNGLVKKERQEIHERAGQVIEFLFRERLPEVYETLAYHFKNGQSQDKAVAYLVKSGEKSFSRYSVEESHLYFKEAFEILSKKDDKTREDEEKIIDLLNKWSFVYYYRGDYRTLLSSLTEYKPLAESLEDKSKLGIFYCWLGAALYHKERIREAYEYLKKTLALGEGIKDHRVIAYASSWLCWVCAELGLLDEAIVHANRGQEVAGVLELEDLYCLSLTGMGQAYWYRGETKKTDEAGRALLKRSQKLGNIRGVVLGHYLIGCSQFMAGDFPSAIESYKTSIRLSADPYYSQWPRMLLGLSYALIGRYEEAEEVVQEVLDFTGKFDVRIIGTPAASIMGIVLAVKGILGQGLRVYEEGRRSYMETQRRWCYALSEYIFGNMYLQIVKDVKAKGIPFVARNIVFMVTRFLSLNRRAEGHLMKAVEEAEKIGARVTLGMAHLALGRLYLSRKRSQEARESLSKAVDVFARCGATAYLDQANEALASLG